MTFRKAVLATPSLKDSYYPGLQALRREARNQIRCSDPRCFTGSINLDEALAEVEPDSPRWDYGLGYKKDEETALWVELHPASSGHVEEVLRKLSWLRNWLRRDAPHLWNLTKGGFYWIAPSGPITITPNSRQAKLLAANGLSGPMRCLQL
jgi:hypothetical protein